MMQLIYLQDSIFDPMLVPPLPWRGVYNGGHLLPSGTFLRLKSQNTQLKPLLMKDCASTVLEKVFCFPHRAFCIWRSLDAGNFHRALPSGARLSHIDVLELIQAYYVRMLRLVQIYYPLNCLGSVPWRINKDVLKVAEALFRSKEEVCGFPRRRSLPIEPPKKR